MRVSDHLHIACAEGVQIAEHETSDTSTWQSRRALTAVLKWCPAVDFAPRHVINSGLRSVRRLPLHGVRLIGTPYLAPVRTGSFAAFVAELHVYHEDMAVRRDMPAHETQDSAVIRAGAGKNIG